MHRSNIPTWKQRYIQQWYDFIKSPAIHNEFRPYITNRDAFTISDKEIKTKLFALMIKHGLPKECWNAVLRYYTEPKAAMPEIFDLIEPIKIKKSTDGGIDIYVPAGSTQTELENFIKLKYSKYVNPSKRRLNAKAAVRKSLIIDYRINKKRRYSEIREYLFDHGIEIDEPNIRSVVSNYKKSMK